MSSTTWPASSRGGTRRTDGSPVAESKGRCASVHRLFAISSIAVSGAYGNGALCYRADMRSKHVVSMAWLIGVHVFSITGCGPEPEASAVDAGGDEPDGAIDTPDGGTARDSGGFDVGRPREYEPASSLEEGCAQRADAMCAITATCNPLGFIWMFGDVEHCRESYEKDCLASALDEESNWQAPELTACANDYAAMSCDQFHFGHAWEACSALTGGPRKFGANCTVDSQCESNECENVGSTGCRECTGGLGASCYFGGPNCKTGLVCLRSEDGFRCSVPPEIGEECEHGFCLGWAQCEEGLCVKPVPAGLEEPCNSSSLFACDEHAGLFCDSQTSTCQPMRFAEVGEACGASNGMRCIGEAVCDTYTHRCVRRAKPGEACEPTFCYRGFECIDGICQWHEIASCG